MTRITDHRPPSTIPSTSGTTETHAGANAAGTRSGVTVNTDNFTAQGGTNEARDFAANAHAPRTGSSMLGLLGQKAQDKDLQLLGAGVGLIEESSPTAEFPKIPGFKIETVRDSWSVDSGRKYEDGHPITLDWNREHLNVNGKQLAGPSQAEADEAKQYFKEMVVDANNEYASGHTYDSGFLPHGSAGSMLSVRESLITHTGDYDSSLRTFDLKNGKEVKLDELLTQKQMDQVYKTVREELRKLPEEERVGYPDPESEEHMRLAINRGFGLTELPNGKVAIDISVPNWSKGVSDFQVRLSAPDTDEFKAKIGMSQAE